ncbi:MAG: MurR/RpiR family transcriptional regulator [Breznakia sp.]
MQHQPIRLQIKAIYRDLSKTEKLIAEYVLENPTRTARKTINEISNDLNIADSTFFQFTKTLGYSGFKDFKLALLTEEYDPSISIHEHIEQNDDEITMANKVFDSTNQSILDTKQLLDTDSLKKAATILSASQIVTFFGIGGSALVAGDAFHKFLRSPLKVQHSFDYHIQLMIASLLTKQDSAIIISHTGLTKEAIEIAKVVKERGAKLILITSYTKTSLAKMADVLFISAAEETEYRSEALTSRISQMTIIDALLVIVMFRNQKEANTSLEKVRKVIRPAKNL